jgi:hypothetical protein
MSKEPDSIMAQHCVQALVDAAQCIRALDFLHSEDAPPAGTRDEELLYSELRLQHTRIRETLLDVESVVIEYSMLRSISWRLYVNGFDVDIAKYVLTPEKVTVLTTLPSYGLSPIIDRASTFLRIMSVRLERGDEPDTYKVTYRTLTGLDHTYVLDVSPEALAG